ncbi:MAG TPA: restriction endonuclease subunit S, partial [Rhodanobacteraceae bacterium]
MAKQSAKTATPRLRFPEFRRGAAWATTELREFSEFVTERVGTTACTPYTVTSGIGLVSQQEKLGRTIAGNSLKNYIVLQRNDFAYNKSATKAFPQGFIARYTGDERAAVPNSIFTCFRADAEVVDPTYLDYLLSTNLHGRWLRGRIAIGARAHGSLNVSDEDLMELPVLLPGGATSLAEQQKIADCLTSLDEVIAAQGRKVEALKAHKRGLMQQLFPRAGETRPRLRFPEFGHAPEWERKKLGEISAISSGATPLRSKPEFYEGGTIPWVKTTDLNNSFIFGSQECVTPKAKVTINPVGSVVVAMYGGFNQIGRTGLLKIPAATIQAL